MRPFFLSIILLLIVAPLSTAAVGPSMWSTLTPEQQAQLSAGKPVVVEEEVAGNPWPRYIVYQLVNSSAEKVASVFWDCELDPDYIPNCLSVQITGKPKPWIHDAEYTLKMPMMLPNEVYTSRNEIQSPVSGGQLGSYEISWKVLEARYICGSTGNLYIEPYKGIAESGENQTLLRYSNLVIPGGSIAGLLRNQARKQVIASVQALVNQIEHEGRQTFAPQIAKFQKDLQAMPIYPQ